MIKTYEVKADVTMSGCFYIEAESPQEAEEEAKKRVFAYDLRDFYHLKTEVLNVQECEE